MLGFVGLNKPSGLTSHDCISRLRKLFKFKKIGHGGTLDPSATGVLPIAIGKATRLIPFLPKNKAYKATIIFGLKTRTDDLEGEIIRVKSGIGLTLEDVKSLLNNFIGNIEQIPPLYSAIQKNGKRLYFSAREGEKVDIPSRTVRIYTIKILDWHPGEFPELTINIQCGSGTYIRSLARDLGEKLGIGGTLAKLVRTKSCGIILPDTSTLERISKQFKYNEFTLIKPEYLLKELPSLKLSSKESMCWCQGQKILINIPKLELFSKFIRVKNEEEFLGIGCYVSDGKDDFLKPKVVIKEIL